MYVHAWGFDATAAHFSLTSLTSPMIMLQIRVLFFAKGRELAGCKEIGLSSPVNTTGQALFDLIIAAVPAYVVCLTCSVGVIRDRSVKILLS